MQEIFPEKEIFSSKVSFKFEFEGMIDDPSNDIKRAAR